LNKNRRFLRIEPARKIIERDLGDVCAHFVGIVEIVRKRLRVCNHNVDFVKFTAVLQLHAAFERAYVMPNV
jgi:hypothetical protein